jgi:hypothetical protein
MEAKIFYNTATDYWRLMIKMDEILEKYLKNNEIWKLNPD